MFERRTGKKTTWISAIAVGVLLLVGVGCAPHPDRQVTLDDARLTDKACYWPVVGAPTWLADAPPNTVRTPEGFCRSKL